MALHKLLRDSEPFNRLPPAALAVLTAAAREETYPAGAFVFRQKDRPTGCLYLIAEGLVEIVVTTPGGVDMVVDYRKEGDFFGATPIFTGEPYTGGARAAQRTVCLLVPSAALQQVTADHPELGEFFTRIVLSRVRRLYSQISADHAHTALSQVEAYPFKKRLSEIMATPVEVAHPGDPARQVARRLIERGIGAVAVVDEQHRPLGMITDRDLVARMIVAEHPATEQLTAAEVMKPGPTALPPETFMYEAMALMQSRRLKYLLVVDRDRLVGIVTPRDLMRYRSQKAMLLLGNVRDEQNLDGLAAIRRAVIPLARTLLAENRGTPEIMEILSHIHHGITRRACELTVAELAEQGLRPPEVRWSLLVMGSSGRREMLLTPDQDHGLIWEDVPESRNAELDAYFARLGTALTENLARIGYPLCPGNVMANNPAWRGRLRDWRERIQEWVNNPEPMKVRYSSIFFDFAPLVGDPSLAHDLRQTLHQEIDAFQGFLYHVMTLDLRHKVPLGLLGRFVVERDGEHQGTLSLKHGGSVYIVDCIRIFALERGLAAAGTLDRLKELERLNIFDRETAEHIRAAFEALTFLRLRNELAMLDQGQEPTSYLDPHALTKNEQDLLKEALGAVSKLQDATRRHFGRTPF